MFNVSKNCSSCRCCRKASKKKKNLHAFHPSSPAEHVTETRPEIPLELRSYFHRVNIPPPPPPLLFLVKNSSLRENIEVASCRWIVVYIYIYTRSTSIEQVEANVLRVCTPVPYPVEHKFNPIYPPSQRDQNVKTNIRVPSSRPPPPPPLLFPLFGIPRGGKLEQKQLEGGGFFKNCWGKIWKKKRETLIFPIQNSRIIKQSYRIWSIFLFE